jgi:hypothetical protein
VIKKILFVVGLLSTVACGAPADGEYIIPESLDELGQVQQPIFMPTNYGNEGVGEPCVAPWANSMCFVPDNKHIQVQFQAGTCSAWWQTRMVSAFAFMEAYVDGLGDDWNMTSPGNGNYQVKCGSTTGFGTFDENNVDIDSHPTPNGQLIQYRKGLIIIDTTDIEGSSTFSGSIESARQKIAHNAIIHEFGHLIAVGHTPTGVMKNGLQTTAQTFTTAQSNMLKCYNEDSGTDDDC